MRSTRSRLFLIPLLVIMFACGSADVVKRKYLEVGNRYFDSGKYNEAQIMYRNAIKKDARFGEAYYRLGLCELRRGRMSDAVRALRRAVELQPENGDAAANLVDIYMLYYFAPHGEAPAASRDKDPVRDEIEDLVRLFRARNKNSFDANRIEGLLAMRDRDYQKAAGLLEAAEKARPDNHGVNLALAQTLFVLGRNDEAEKLALAGIQKDKTFGPMYDVLFRYYMNEKRPVDAEKMLKEKVDASPKNAAGRLELARFYFVVNKRPEMEKVLDQILRDRADFPQGLLLVGDFYARLRQFDQATTYYREGAETGGPDKSTYQTRQVETMVAQNRLIEATNMLDAILKENPKNEQAMQMRAALRLQNGSPEEVKKAVSELLALADQQPKNPVLRFNLGRAYMTLNELDAAMVQLQQSVDLKPDFVQPHLALAQIYLLKRQSGKALTEANEVLKYEPDNFVAKLVRSSSLMASGMLDQARSEIEQTLKTNPNSAEGQFQLGLVYLAEKKPQEAESAFGRLLKIAPNDSRGVYGLAEVKFSRGDSAGAIDLLEAQTEKFPERSDYRYALANSLLRASQFQEAIEQYKLLLAKEPQSTDLNLRIGETYRRSGNLKASVEHFERAHELSPKDATAGLFLAVAYDTGGRRNTAKPLYEEVLHQQPDNPIALNNLAYILAEEGTELDRAVTLAQRAKQRLPNDSNVSDTLGWIYIKKNLPDSAVPIFEELVKKEPSRATFFYHLGLALHLRGDDANARKSFEAALKKNPSKEEERRIKELVSTMG